MKAKVKKPLNERGGKPSVNAPNNNYYNPGDLLEIIDIVNGDTIDNNSLWFKLNNGKYVWSGGVEGVVDIETDVHEDIENTEVNIKVQDLDIIKNLPKEIRNATGKGVTVAVLDSGINRKHPALENQITFSKNYIINEDIITNAHGTLVAGIIAGNSLDFKGLAPNARLEDYRIINNKNMVNRKKLTEALNHLYSSIASHNSQIKIINMSLSIYKSNYDSIKDLLNKITNLGVIIVAAAGSPKNPKLISNIKEIVRVGTRSAGDLSNFEILFNNEIIKSTTIPKNNMYYDGISNSSAYTAVVSGIIAKFLSRNDFTNDNIVKETINFIKKLNN